MLRYTSLCGLLLAAMAAPAAALPLAPGLVLTVADGKAGMAAVPLDKKGEATGNLRLTVRRGNKGVVTLWTVELTDLSGHDRWLEVALAGRPALKGPARYFSGVGETDLSEPYETPEYQQPLPLAALWSGAGGLAIGLEPHETVSYVHHTARAEGLEMALQVRLVVEAGKARSLTFVSLPLSGKWGFFEALERYYDLAPDVYEPDPARDPRLFGASAMYAAWQAEPGPNWKELCRRNFATWDWCYAPFKRTGDIVGRPEFWDYTPARPEYKRGMPFETREKFLAWRKERFSGGERGGVAMLCYVPAQVWCEERLARERYPDAITKDPNTVCVYNTPWCTGWDNEVRVLPWNTSFGEQSKRDLADVARDLDLAGYAFDTAEGVSRYFGPRVKEFPERAWDPKLGEYVREAVATTALMRAVNTLRNSSGRSVGVVGNLDHPYYLVARGVDAGLHEANAWEGGRGRGDFARYAMGRKPIAWWDGYGLHELLQWERITADEVVDATLGASDFTLLESFRIGYLPTVDFTRGIMSAAAALPALTECVRAGWHPVSGATAEGVSFITRYGRGLQTRLAMGNETLSPARPTIKADCRWLGEGSFVFATREGQPLENTFAAGETRVAGVEVPAHKVGVLRAWAGITPALGSGSARVAVAADLNAPTLTLTCARPLPEGSSVSVPLPAGMLLRAATVDGRPARQSEIRNPKSEIPSVSVPAGKGRQVVFAFVSTRYALGRQDLESFPFAGEGRPAATLVLRPGASEEEQVAAERLAEYFRYYFAGAPDQPVQVTLPIRRGAEGVSGPLVVLDGAGGAFARTLVPSLPKGAGPTVARAGNRLALVAPEPASCRDALLDVLRALDRKYAYPGTLPWRVHNNKAGIVGKYIGLDGHIHGTPPKP